MERLGDALSRLKIRGNIARVVTAGSSGADTPAEEPPVCPRCRDAGFLRRDVPAGHPEFGKTVICPCRKQEVAERRQSRLERLSNLGSLTRLTFENLNSDGRLSDPANRERYRQIVDRAHRFAECPDGWLLLTGPSGRGKTHIAAAIANARLAKGESVIFSVVPDLLDHLRAAFSPNSEISYDELFDRIREAPLLILDDLGTQSSTPWAQEKLFQLLNHRYNGRLPTVVTTNLPPEALDNRLQTRLLESNLTRIAYLDDDGSSLNNVGGLKLQRLVGMTFASFRPEGSADTMEQRDSMRRLFGYVRHFAANPYCWLVLLGSNGTGKTHLAAAIANERLALKQPAVFVVVPELLDHLRSTFAPESAVTYDRVFDEVRSSPLLILDDLGSQSGTPWAQEKLFQLLNYRYNATLPTVITSNLPPDDHDPRLRSRMADKSFCAVWAIDAPAYRHPKELELPQGDRRKQGRPRPR